MPNQSQQTMAFGIRPASAPSIESTTSVEPNSEVGTVPETHAGTSNVTQPSENVQTYRSQEPKTGWVGKRIDKYAIEKLLGSGGMGEVFLGRHCWLDTPVAVKILRPMFGNDQVAVERFHREAKLVARLSHPNIVKAIDGGPVDDSCFLVTEYLDGLDLFEVVERRGPLSTGEACAIICQMCKGLHHAHVNHVIHRDVKPQNAMVLRDGTVKLLDLGLARLAIADAATQMTATGQFMGTVDYVSPEQALDTSNLDHRADIYSLGCTLYFLLTGRPPFFGAGYESVVSKILAHTDEAHLPINMLRSSVPRDVLTIVDRMLAKCPTDRPQSTLEVADVLQKHATPIEVGKLFIENKASDNRLALNQPSPSAVDGLIEVWKTILMFVMRMMGIIERVEINPNARSAASKQYRHQLRIGAVFGWLIFLGLAYFIVSSMEIIEYGPSGDYGRQPSANEFVIEF